MFYVYVLRSGRTGRRYVGSYEDVNERVRRHNAGHSKSTRHGAPWILIHRESFFNQSRSREKNAFTKADVVAMNWSVCQ
jgi:predicted GIY-YIG superfamily endonuclease